MDDHRFDSLTRTINSRRAVGGALIGAVAAQLGLTNAGAARCPKGKKRCGKQCIPKKGCCTTAQCKPGKSGKVCRNHRCVCRAGTKRCKNQCLPRGAACPPKPDASCRPGGGSTSGYAWHLRTAQTFTEPNGGRLTAASLWIRNSPETTGTYELRVYPTDPATGAPQQESPLALAQRTSASVSNTALDWVRFDFANPPRLKPSQRYALVLTMVGGNPSSAWLTEHRTGDPCPGSELFVANPTGPFGPRPGTDTPFQTFVRP